MPAEAHIWVKDIGRQVYLGGYEAEEHAAEAYDVAALKCKGVKVNYYSLLLEDQGADGDGMLAHGMSAHVSAQLADVLTLANDFTSLMRSLLPACRPSAIVSSGAHQLWAGALRGAAALHGHHQPGGAHHGRAPPEPGLQQGLLLLQVSSK